MAPPSSPVGAAATRVATAPVATALCVFDPNEQVTFANSAKVALEAMGKKHLFLGKTGAGARMKLVVNMIMGSSKCMV